MARKRRHQAIRIPDWVPRPVAHLVHIMFEQETRQGVATGSIELLRRLACDPRMKGVWAELLKRKRAKYRTTADFFHSASSGLQTFWSPEARSRLRRANAIRSLGDGEPSAEANNSKRGRSWRSLRGRHVFFLGLKVSRKFPVRSSRWRSCSSKRLHSRGRNLDQCREPKHRRREVTILRWRNYFRR